MQQAKTVDLADVFGSIVNQLQNDRQQINALDEDNRNHGDNALYNFQLVQQALQGMRGRGADAQLREAAEILRRNGRGATADMYAEGFQDAAARLHGQQNLGLDDLLPLLRGILGGVQRRTDAQPGQGTLIDSLLPAISAFASARQSGRGNIDAIRDAIGAATRGAQTSYQQPSRYGRARGRSGQAWRDPGAESARSMLEGLFKTFMG